MYRDLVEGGKPQMLFEIQLNQKRSEVEKTFLIKANESPQDKGEENGMDGKIVFVSEDSLKKAFVASDEIACRADIDEHDNKFKLMKMVPSTSASIAMYLIHEENQDKRVGVASNFVK